MKIRLVLTLLFILIFSLPLFAQGKVYLITISDEVINPVTAEYISGAVTRAENEKAACLVIQLDTPGGLLTSTRTIVKSIMNAGVPIVVYVAPSGARAGSAGVFITMAGHIAAMAPSTNIGAAHPVELAEKRSTEDLFGELVRALRKEKTKDERQGTRDKKAEEKKEPMEQKVLNDTIAWAKTIAENRGRNERWAEKAVVESVSITEGQAMKDGVVDLIAAGVNELLDKIDGKQVKLPSGSVILHTKGAVTVELPMNFRTRVLSKIAHPNIILILMMLGFYGLLFEFTHSGGGFPGVAGAICLILAFFGMQVLPTNYAGVALLMLAIILFIAEVKVVSYGLLTLGGLVSLFLGSLILFPSPYEFMRVSIPLVLAMVLATLIIVGFLMFVVIRANKRRVRTGAEGLIGEVGEVKSWNGTNGKVFVHGELWNAGSEEELEKGARVEVVRVEGMKLVIRKIVG